MKVKLFNSIVTLAEAYNQGEIHSNMSSEPIQLPDSYMLMLYPRNGTPVCMQELRDLQKIADDLPCPVYAGSMDSPEMHNMQFGYEDEFPDSIDFPVITINPDDLTDEAKVLCLNSGRTQRRTLWVVDGHIVDDYGMYESDSRSMEEIIRKTEIIFSKEEK